MESMEKEIITRYGADVTRFVSRTVRQREDAEELVQDVFVRALRAKDQFDASKSSIRTWLTRIAYNEVMRYHERQSHRPMMVELNELRDDKPESLDDDPRQAMLEMAIRRLKKEERLLLSMRYADGLSMREMTFITGLKEGNLAVRLLRIRERLKNIIKEIEHESQL